MSRRLLACFQPFRNRHSDNCPGSDADNLNRCRNHPADSSTSSGDSEARRSEQTTPVANGAPAGDAADLPLVRSPSACSDASRHSTVPPTRYRKIRELNSGANGVVSLAVDKQTGEQVAIKLVPCSHGLQAELCIRELLNHQKCAGHPNVVALRDVFLTRNHLALVLEFANDGDLSQVISRHLISQGGPLPEARARALFQQLVSAVDYSHRLNVVSRDIKLDNILLSSPAPRHGSFSRLPSGGAPDAATAAAAADALGPHLSDGSAAAANSNARLRHSLSGGSSMSVASVASLSASSAGSVSATVVPGPVLGEGVSGGSLWHRVQQLKLADFGLSKADEAGLGSGVRGTVCGTPEYMAPEVLQGHKYDGRKVDIWSCGVVLYVMAAGNYPFLNFREERMARPERMSSMFPRMLSGDFYPLPSGSSPHMKDLLRRMLMPDPGSRISIAEIQQHPWYLQDLPPALATLNDRLLANRSASPPPPLVTSPGIVAALEATAKVMQEPLVSSKGC